MNKAPFVAILTGALLLGGLQSKAVQSPVSNDPMIETLNQELARSVARLKHAGKAPMYYLAYRLYEGNWDSITASNGALLDDNPKHRWRMLGIDLRVGSPKLDNTHFIRGESSGPPAYYDNSTHDDSILPNYGSGLPLRECLWLKTDDAFKQAQRRYFEVRASNDVLAAEEDKSGDFSVQPPHQFDSGLKQIPIDRAAWEAKVKRLSKIFVPHHDIQESTVSFSANPTTRFFVNSEGSQLIEQHLSYRLGIRATTIADDGMTLWLWDSAEAPDPALMPDEQVMAKRIEHLANRLDELRVAPAADSYVGPAILSSKAAAVFFHETFGHRIEAVHEKSESEGKTFARKVGTAVMPKFISVIDDPTISKAHGEYLNGHYVYDDEGVLARAATLTKNGILTGFLLSRTPVQGFAASNGHGRSSPGWNPMARQANLFVYADKTKQVSPQALRALLIQEAKRQHKSYGLLFDEVSGGFTYTASASPQTYNINPLVVYKVFVDGRPDQLIRGADIVGTPLAALEKIVAASTDYGVFNGECGRESGPVPVSAVAPGLLIQSIEIKRTAKSFFKVPILPDPTLPHPHAASSGQAGHGK